MSQDEKGVHICSFCYTVVGQRTQIWNSYAKFATAQNIFQLQSNFLHRVMATGVHYNLSKFQPPTIYHRLEI